MMVRRKISQPPPRKLILVIISILVLFSQACALDWVINNMFSGYKENDEQRWYDFLSSQDDPDSSEVPQSPGDPGSSGGSGSEGYLADESSAPAPTGGESTSSTSGDLKPVGFVNYGEFDAVVMPYTYIPLGETNQVSPAQTSTVSSANDGVGDWPNTSRYLTLPMGTYSWCIDWEEGDLDEDGEIDYFHYIQNGPTVLDEEDSDELDFAEEVAISAPPSAGAVYEGRCEPAPINDSCAGQSQHLQVYTAPGWLPGTEFMPEVYAWANTAEFPPNEEGITVTAAGGYGFQKAWIMYQAGEYMEATFSGPYTAAGVQPHGDYIIGWARVTFDGVEVWRGDTSAYYHDAEGYMHAVYIEVRCFPPGTHTLRIECLGEIGSGGAKGSGGKTDVPIAFFGFRK
jgi:hypothetical protein